MKTIQVFDKPMCCSSGVCGPQVDPVLPQFAADLDWLQSQGHRVERFNLAQQPAKFIEEPTVHRLLSTEGTDCLPLILVDGGLAGSKVYPSRATLALWAAGGLPTVAAGLPTVAAGSGGGCCSGGTNCC